MLTNKRTFFALVLALACAACGNSGNGPVTAQQAPSAAVAATPSALPAVLLLPEQLSMPGLNRKRQIRLYLPPAYATSTKHYPVLYMHDGQNLFDNATAYGGEWKVDETMDALAREGKLELIVVGIDNGEAKRMTELNAWSNLQYGPGEGELYMDFIVKVLKPLIDKQYRTMPERDHTALMGSSMGGLISHYGINQYPEVFGKAGIFSPSYWAAGSAAFNFAASRPARSDARLYLLIGALEGGPMVPDAQRMYDQVIKRGHPSANATLKIVPNGNHNEAFWSSEFREAILWLFPPA
ncbi:alpha/beta hydrolase [Massilia sp. TSP1-1-2]|uniref:alpha/beta hydrolase n=1 Tax=unclassified Massilia TaxID=2609279 RepID=UPI003CF3F85C